MDAGEYGDTLRYVIGAAGPADAFRAGIRSDDWGHVRQGMRDMLLQLQREVIATRALDEPLVQEEVRVFGLGRAVDALDDPEASEVERAYRVACGLAYSLQAIINQVGYPVEG